MERNTHLNLYINYLQNWKKWEKFREITCDNGLHSVLGGVSLLRGVNNELTQSYLIVIAFT